jgi:protein PET100
MYYFGTNLDEKFSVPGFWPTKAQSNRVPQDRKELDEELVRLKNIRLHLRQQRLEDEALAKGDFEAVRKLRTESTEPVTSSSSSWWSSRSREG